MVNIYITYIFRISEIDDTAEPLLRDKNEYINKYIYLNVIFPFLPQSLKWTFHKLLLHSIYIYIYVCVCVCVCVYNDVISCDIPILKTEGEIER